MGLLIDGVWQTEDHFPTDAHGEFVRRPTTLRGRITTDGSSPFPAVAGRYHLYVSYACPWAHRTLMVRALRGLEEAISVSVVDPFMGPQGWTFSAREGLDEVNGLPALQDVYRRADPRFTGRVTVPLLWDRETRSIVNNESSQILRMFNDAFGPGLAAHPEVNLAPPELRDASDAMRERLYHPFNNGVYRAGFARSQTAYERAVTEVFATLDALEVVLGRQRYLCSDTTLTEADLCAFATLVRFDPVYVGHFKCNVRRIADYEHLPGYVRDLHQTPGIAATVRLDHIKEHYYRSHGALNPSGIVPVGPELDLDRPHGRG